MPQPNTIADLRGFQSSQAPLPENNFVGVNYSRYQNADLDAAISRFFTNPDQTYGSSAVEFRRWVAARGRNDKQCGTCPRSVIPSERLCRESRDLTLGLHAGEQAASTVRFLHSGPTRSALRSE